MLDRAVGCQKFPSVVSCWHEKSLRSLCISTGFFIFSHVIKRFHWLRLWTIVVACSDFDRSIGDMAVFWVVVGLSIDSAQAQNIPQKNARWPGCFIDRQTFPEPNSYEKFIFFNGLIILELILPSRTWRLTVLWAYLFGRIGLWKTIYFFLSLTSRLLILYRPTGSMFSMGACLVESTDPLSHGRQAVDPGRCLQCARSFQQHL